MNKTPHRRFADLLFAAMLLASANHAIHAQDRPKPAGQKEGINLYIRFAEPVDRENPKILCELENTTDTLVVFQRRGAAYGDGFGLHLMGEDGKEIEKTPEWSRLYEIGSNIKVFYGLLKPLAIFGPFEIELEKAYGRKWTSGARLDIDWNAGGTRTGPGPHGGQFGIGTGVSGSLELTLLTGKKFEAPKESGTVENPTEEEPASHDDASHSGRFQNGPPEIPVQPSPESSAAPSIPQPQQPRDATAPDDGYWIWLILGGVMLFVIVGFVLKRLFRRRNNRFRRD